MKTNMSELDRTAVRRRLYAALFPAGKRENDWRHRARCAPWSPEPWQPELFFPIAGSLRQQARIDKALEICSRCPVRRQCLRCAIRMPFNPAGIWGGTTAPTRKRIRAENRQEASA